MENRNQKKANQKKTAPILLLGSPLYARLNYDADKLALQRVSLVYKNNQLRDSIIEKSKLLEDLEAEVIFMKGLVESDTYPEKKEAEYRLQDRKFKFGSIKSRLEKLQNDKQRAEVNLFLCEAQLEAYRQMGLIPTNFESPKSDL